ncbi:hypothetical protein M7I_1475 [Glarea lozoyensis 74030]|uniref:Uncharacterized protein n=1 Tax=Glarea lozoyensis (strain ATCC 74030 / MF5533) TaxID=1104152 RepID=H0EG65_GLAL7|nr:hypothetical protein M7I_1475 [Glarea lozoyensis 74030]
MSRPLTTSVVHNDDNSASDSSSEHEPSPPANELSEIHLRINTPLTIQGNNNTVSIDTAMNANKIQLGVVNALRQMTSAAMGVPMIDEDGRPRPIKISVNAEIRVVGTGNVVGDKAIDAKNGGEGEGKGEKVNGEMEKGKEKETAKRARDGDEASEMVSKRVMIN